MANSAAVVRSASASSGDNAVVMTRRPGDEQGPYGVCAKTPADAMAA
jgi:hypothetical protein